jgi:hypothetical protein
VLSSTIAAEMQKFHASDFDWLADLQKSKSTCECVKTRPDAIHSAMLYNMRLGEPCEIDRLWIEWLYGTASLTDWHELLQLTAPDPYSELFLLEVASQIRVHQTQF